MHWLTHFLFLFLIYSAYGDNLNVHCDANGNISQLELSTVEKINFNPSKVNSEQILKKYCDELNSCLDFLGSTSISGIQDVMREIQTQPGTNSINSKSELISKIKQMQSRIDSCNRKKTKATPKKIKIEYTLKGPNRAITSSNYDYSTVKKIVQLSLINGVDPFMALSIMTIESPRIASESHLGGYESGYGDLPIDGLPVFDKLGCIYKIKPNQPNKYANASQEKEFKSLLASNIQKKAILNQNENRIISDIVTSSFSTTETTENILRKLMDSKDCKVDGVSPEVQKKFCNTPNIRDITRRYIEKITASSELGTFTQKLKKENFPAYLELSLKNDPETSVAIVPPRKIKSFTLPWGGQESHYLCSTSRPYPHGQFSGFSQYSNPKSDECCVKVEGVIKGDDPERELLNFLAFDLIRERIIQKPGSVDFLSYDIQPYNGNGCLGCSEKLSNSCLNRIHMGTRPYYGARVADLMLNSMMNNSEIRNIVLEAASELEEPVKSIFCKKLGAGKNEIDKSVFLNQQKEFLLSGSNGMIKIGNEIVEYKLPTGKNGFQTPKNDAQKEEFKKSEDQRRASCEKYFK